MVLMTFLRDWGGVPRPASLGRGFSAAVHTLSVGKIPFRSARAGRVTQLCHVVEMPCGADDGVHGVGILRLRMASTAWTSCFAQDDKIPSEAKAWFHLLLLPQR